MSQRPHGQAPPMGDLNYAALLFQQQADGSTRWIGATSGGWEQQFGWEQQADGRSQLQQDSPVLPWLENTVQGGQRRQVLPPNSAAATASNPFLDVCSDESWYWFLQPANWEILIMDAIFIFIPESENLHGR